VNIQEGTEFHTWVKEKRKERAMVEADVQKQR